MNKVMLHTWSQHFNMPRLFQLWPRCVVWDFAYHENHCCGPSPLFTDSWHCEDGCLMRCLLTSVSEEFTSFIIRVVTNHPNDGGSTCLRNSGQYQTRWCHIPEDCHYHTHYYENLSHIQICWHDVGFLSVNLYCIWIRYFRYLTTELLAII